MYDSPLSLQQQQQHPLPSPLPWFLQFFDSGLPAARASSLALQTSLVDVELRVRAAPGETLRLCVGRSVVATAAQREALAVAHARMGGVEMARFTFDRSACAVGVVHDLDAEMMHVPQPQNSAQATAAKGTAAGARRQEQQQQQQQQQRKPRVCFRLRDTLPTPEQADAFFEAWDRQQALYTVLRRAADAKLRLKHLQEESRADSVRASLMAEEVSVEKGAVVVDGTADLETVTSPSASEAAATNDGGRPSHAASAGATRDNQQHGEEQNEQERIGVLVNGSVTKQVAPLAAEERAGAEEKKEEKESGSEKQVPDKGGAGLHNDWTGDDGSGTSGEQRQLEIAELQRELEDLAVECSSELGVSVEDAMAMLEASPQLPPLGDSVQEITISDLGVSLAADHAVLLGRFTDDYQDPLPPPRREIKVRQMKERVCVCARALCVCACAPLSDSHLHTEMR